MKTDNVPESAERGDIGEFVGDITNQSVAVDKTQPILVKSFQTDS